MKKQITYTKFIPRIFAAAVDLTILVIIVSPIINFISTRIFLFIFKDFFSDYQINIENPSEIEKALLMPEAAQYVTSSSFITYVVCLLLLNLLLMGGYFITFWIYKNATPGKMLMRMKIVDEYTFEIPTKYQYFKRFIYYFTAFMGIWYIIFTHNGKALHDKMAKTVVIKA